MAPKQPCAKYQYVVTPAGPKILPVEEPCKDEESPADYNAGGYLPVKVGDTFNAGRYRVVRKLGWGHFSTVWLVRDSQSQRHSALKVVKSAGRYAETARDEIKLLSKVASFSPDHPGRNFIVSFLDSFSHQGPESSHVCIVFEPLGENLLALIERNKKKGVPRALVRVIAKQILLGLEYLHDECDLVHTDIKPENILISIPDIETHISYELSQSPSPPSRRVGVPLPAKTRTGVTIPYNQQRARRQVQIFESQPLASPGRSLGRSAHGNSSLSMNARLDPTGSGNASQSGSYIPHSHLSRPASGFASGIAGSFSSSAPKVPSGLSVSAPRNDSSLQKTAQLFAAKGIAAVPPQVANCPSSSSSSSSISSVLASATAGTSSIVSTPPTSLSHSLGNAIVEFMGTGNFETELRTRVHISPKTSEDDSQALLIPKKARATAELEFQLSCAMSSSWKKANPSSDIAKDAISCSVASNKSTKSSKARTNHNRSNSGLPPTWQDPGVAAPAPAVLVSTVVGADGREEDLTKSPGLLKHTVSQTSSGTTTIARPSPSRTPLAVSKDNVVTLSSLSKDAYSAEDGSASNNTLASLLSRTAPSRTKSAASSAQRSSIRPSPPQQVSQLSAHMHSHRPSLTCHPSEATTQTKPNASSRPARLLGQVETTADTTRPPSPTAAPPPTPVDTPMSPLFPPTPALAHHGKVELHLRTVDNEPIPPPISIKIADLGNATPSTKHFTEDIQTRQYRAPEAIVGRKDWDARADVWSVACLIFELLTAEYLFDPQGQGELFTKDDDHMAQIIELLGDFSLEVKMGGKYSRELFDSSGALRYIRTLKPWPLERVMIEKYLFSEADAAALCQFLLPMLTVDMRDRAHARDMRDDKWLQPTSEDGDFLEW